MRSLILVIIALNALDFLFTSYWLAQEDVATESNPIMAPAFQHSVWAALGLKAVLVGLGLIVIARLEQESRWARWSLWVGCVAYGAVVVYHVVGGLL